MKIPIVYEDKDLIVIEKPAGLLVHPVENEKNTLIDFFPKAKLVHRLDKDTSGLLLLAKNEKIFNWLKSQFSAAAKSYGGSTEAFGIGGKNRPVIKKYLALVHGKLKDKKGIITKTISKSRKRGGSQTTTPIGKRREAVTRYKILKEYCPKPRKAGSDQKCYTLLEVMPETGRTHQIRVHLSSIGHPIAGDEKYKFKRQFFPKNLKRQFLHATYLKFQLPSEEIKEFESKLPKDLQEILKKLVV